MIPKERVHTFTETAHSSIQNWKHTRKVGLKLKKICVQTNGQVNSSQTATQSDTSTKAVCCREH